MSTLGLVGLSFGLVAFFIVELVFAVMTETGYGENMIRLKASAGAFDSSSPATEIREYTGYEPAHPPVIRVRVCLDPIDRVDLEKIV
ncbi:MAG: hypothetical protein HZC40_16660 [Chloroflexi bacterium]|nr:hypothetical protein [Chloroflexota bacterium]